MGSRRLPRPSFPTLEGTRAAKPAAVATIIALAARLGAQTRCASSGGELYGGHSLRTGGAQYLAGLGVDPIRIQSMGRWRSTLVIRYSGQKGAHGITEDTVKGLGSASSTDAPPSAARRALCDSELDAAARAMAALDTATRDRSLATIELLNTNTWHS